MTARHNSVCCNRTQQAIQTKGGEVPPPNTPQVQRWHLDITSLLNLLFPSYTPPTCCLHHCDPQASIRQAGQCVGEEGGGQHLINNGPVGGGAHSKT